MDQSLIEFRSISAGLKARCGGQVSLQLVEVIDIT